MTVEGRGEESARGEWPDGWLVAVLSSSKTWPRSQSDELRNATTCGLRATRARARLGIAQHRSRLNSLRPPRTLKAINVFFKEIIRVALQTDQCSYRASDLLRVTRLVCLLLSPSRRGMGVDLGITARHLSLPISCCLSTCVRYAASSSVFEAVSKDVVALAWE